MTTVYYVKNNREYEDIKYKIKVEKSIPEKTKIVFIKKFKSEGRF